MGRFCHLMAAVMLVVLAVSAQPPGLKFTVACSPRNDLYRVLLASGAACSRYDSPEEAIRQAAKGSGVLILAEHYPQQAEAIPTDVWELAARKQLRLYVEYAAFVPGISTAAPRAAPFERAVIASDAFDPELRRLRILGIQDCHFVPVDAAAADIVLARVAGFDTAVYGLPTVNVFPILFKHPDKEIMVATTALSHFVTARFAPSVAWGIVWQRILTWVSGSESTPRMKWTPAVRPSYGKSDALPGEVERTAADRSIEWFRRSRMLVHSSWRDKLDAAGTYPDRVAPAPGPNLPTGDGSEGVLEGFASSIHADGSQSVRWWLRADCIGETAFSFALAGGAANSRVADHLNDFLFFRSILQQGARAQPASPSFGLLGWNTTPKYSGNLDGFAVYYGDDNARAILGALGTAAVLETNRWDESIARCILANFRTTGKRGFRGKRIDEPELVAHGWRYYFDRNLTDYAPHYEAYLWAVYLWAYRDTGYQPFLDRAREAIAMTMRAYPDRWQWTNGLQQERARMLLPLAWLVRLEDTAEHRRWLARIASDLLRFQDTSGAIREEIGAAGHGDYGPPKTNETYGITEAPLIQENGDPLTDLLYTANFAFVGLHEAVAATGSQAYADAENKLAAFLCRVQVRSETHPELDGAWFRAFDYSRWDYWASNADAGWGAWSVETGWTQSWIGAVFRLRTLRRSYWDLTARSGVGERIREFIQRML